MTEAVPRKICYPCNMFFFGCGVQYCPRCGKALTAKGFRLIDEFHQEMENGNIAVIGVQEVEALKYPVNFTKINF